MKVDLNNNVALVTGAAQGIGRAIADTMADNGARVYYADIQDLETDRGIPIKLDVSDDESVINAVHAIIQAEGHIDILVNNAGINTHKHRVTIDEFPKDEWDRIMRVDLDGLYMVSREVSRQMLKQGSGRIINIASVAGLVPLRLQCVFTAAKAGVINLTKAMAIELGGRGVLVNGIAPGSVLTEGTRKLFYGEDGQFNSKVQELLDHIPLGRPGTPEEIAAPALFLAAPESSYINGHILTVDGGWTSGYTRNF